MHVLTRLRRRRVPYWAVAGTVALLTAVVIGRIGGAAAAERTRWGTSHPVIVVTSTVRAGGRLEGHVAARDLPVALLPRNALATVPPGAVAATDLVPGEVVLAHRLAGRSTVAARMPSGTRAVAVPTAGGLPLEVGDRVDVLATFDTGDPTAEPTVTVADDAIVLATGKESVTLAVARSAAPRVAYALAAGTITVVLSG